MNLVGYAGTDYDFDDKLFGEPLKELPTSITHEKGADINRFLIDWGLNMVGNPPSGNVLQTAAKQAQETYRRTF